jgi:iron complex transport system ATP-binding protein
MRDAVVRRQGNTILEVESFQLNKGESLAILGANGAGKSTFIQLITREIFPLHRDIPPVLFKGSDRVELTELRQSLGIVSATMQQQICIHVPAEEIVAGGFFGSLGVPKHLKATGDQLELTHQVMERLGIGDLIGRDIMTLSSGQARRVLIARAVVHNPEILIFDEPCTGLDPAGMHWVRKTMSDLARAGHSILLVTHYPEDIVPEIGRLLLIKDGALVADGPKEKLLTTETVSALFGVNLEVIESRGRYSILDA